ncbi:polysaccharide deacetylase family protein [Paenibacillus farraposensis]|uniref:Polysaccharide deacetylase family protein n=1 Tax=Paenibacillus farraposensis TaxID=2807095 RepID=A0ABW4D9P5_9BACL|nr:polysaccharide deacetylase family protein [Paenibacillus farraposensis]MCC3378864.1 polysaccharide deacetylase family protein [Paenibacillus farraposensis]
MKILLLWMFYISTFYAFIPALLSRLFGFRVFRRGKSEQEYALTFDDGPDPVYTPQLLDLLKRFDAKATFFVVGLNAEKHPELLQRMHEEGHLIGIHNYVHKSNWLMRPVTVRRQIAQTEAVIRRVTGEGTTFYRPPWGIVNFFDISKSNGRRIVLWSSMFGDWKASIGAKQLAERMLKKLRGGEVMLLHDCGTTLGADEEAPQNMLIALEELLTAAQERQMRSVRVDTLFGHQPVHISNAVETPDTDWFKRTLVFGWLFYERLFHTLFRLRPVRKENTIFYYRRGTYHGPNVNMENDRWLKKGDPIIELHFDNQMLYRLGSTAKSVVHLAIQLIRIVKQQLPDLADQLVHDSRMNDVKAIYGVSMINRGSEKLGFQVRELPKGLHKRASTLYLKLLFSVIHPSGPEPLSVKKDAIVPKLILMPIDTLLDRFQQGDPNRTDQVCDPTHQGDVAPMLHREVKEEVNSIQTTARASQAADTGSEQLI